MKQAKPTSNHIFLEVHVPDFAPVFDFYGRLGFSAIWKSSDYLVMSLADNVLGFYGDSDAIYAHPYFRKFRRSTPRGYGVEITIQIVDDIKKYYTRVSPKLPSQSFASPIRQVDYGTSKKWEFRLVDPFGYYLHFTEPVNYLYK